MSIISKTPVTTYHLQLPVVASPAKKQQDKKDIISSEILNRLFVSKQFIDKNIHTSLTVKEIAATAFISEYYFSRLFKEVFNVSPHQYYLIKKAENAAELLFNTDLPISKIADEAGFRDIYSFSRAFKTIYNINPSVYRKQNKKDYPVKSVSLKNSRI